jgi:ABC-type oligopeptide transport system substrate-binding subunit
MAVAWMWQQNLGVELEIEVVEWQTFLQELREQRFQVFDIAWVADYPDPQNFLDVLFHSGSAENHTAYSNPRIDQLLEEARSESDLDARVAIYQQVEQIIVEDAPWLPLFFDREFLLVKPHVKGFFVAPMAIPYLKDIWIER